jgi:hypothetical protein
MQIGAVITAAAALVLGRNASGGRKQIAKVVTDEPKSVPRLAQLATVVVD